MRLLHLGEAGKNANLAWFHRIAPGKAGAPVLVLCGSLLVSHDGAPVAREETPRMAGHRKAPRKVAGDLLISGRAWPNAAEYGHERAVRIGVEQGRWRKELAVFGDRLWHIGVLGASITEPVPFSSIPVTYERAFGGTGYRPNPAGRGMGEGTQGDLLPNIEYPEHQVQLRTHRPPPAGFGPIPASCSPRAERLGTYDAAWLAQDWPGMPQDFDPRYWNEAPSDQQFPEFFKGDERFIVLNMHKEQKRAEIALPGKRLRAFLQRQDGAFAEMPLMLDTVDIDMETGQTELVWRGAVAVKSPRLRDIKFLFTAIEPLAAAIAPETYQAQFEALRRAAYPTREEAKADEEKAAAARQAEADAATAALAASLKTALDLTKAADAHMAEQAAKAGKYAPTTSSPVHRDAMTLLAGRDPGKAARLTAALAGVTEDMQAAPGEKGPAWTRERVIEAHAQGASMAGADLSGLDLSGLTLAGAQLSGANFTGATLSRCWLQRAHLERADFTDAVAEEAQFGGAHLAGARFTGATLKGARFGEAGLAGADFSKLVLPGASFDRAHGARAVFSEANLAGASFRGASLPRADFSKANVTDAAFDNAVLTQADFAEAVAERASFAHADMANFRAHQTNAQGAVFVGVKAECSVWQRALLGKADFSRAALNQANFAEAMLEQAQFDRALLEAAQFGAADLRFAVVTNAKLVRAILERADLRDADFSGSNLYKAGLFAAASSRIKLEGAFLAGTLMAS